MTKFNQLPALIYSPLDISGFSTNENLSNNFRNPFVKLEDKIKLHSRPGTFMVVQLEDNSFTVTIVNQKWYLKRVKEFNCSWDDFKCWARQV